MNPVTPNWSPSSFVYPWYMKPILWFCKSHTVIEDAKGAMSDYPWKTVFKRFNGKIYIIKSERLK